MRTGKMTELGKSPLIVPDSAPVTCSFCGGTLNESLFVAFTKIGALPAMGAICTGCLKKFSNMATLMESIAIYADPKPDYLPMRLRMLNSMILEPGSPAIKKAVVDICIQVLQRTSAVIHGELSTNCPKTGVSLLKPKPIMLVGLEAPMAGKLFRCACEAAGIFFEEAAPDLTVAFQNLVKQANYETTWAEHGIIFCSGSYRPPSGITTTVFGSLQPQGLKDSACIFV